MPDSTGSDTSRTAIGARKPALAALSLFLLAGLALSATLQEESLASKTVGPGAEDVVALNFTFQGDRVIDGNSSLFWGTSLTDGMEGAWSLDSWDDGDNVWESGEDFIGYDNDSDGVYTPQNDTHIAGVDVTSSDEGDNLTDDNPWGNVTFYDGDTGDGAYDFSEDAIVLDQDNDTYLTNATLDTKLSGTDSISEGDPLMMSEPENWNNVSYYDYRDNGEWVPENDSIILENSTADSFQGVFDKNDDTVIAGNSSSSMTDGVDLVLTKPDAWTDIKFFNGTEVGWDHTDDAIVNDTAGNGTYSTANDTTINGTELSNEVDLTATNPFRGESPELAFNDSASAGTEGSWDHGSDLILNDYGNLTVSTTNDTLVAGGAPSQGSEYKVNGFYSEWNLTSYDHESEDSSYDGSEDAIVVDDDTDGDFGHTLTGLTLENGSAADEDDISGLDLFAENDSSGDDQVFNGTGKEAYVGNFTYMENQSHWRLDNLTWNFTSSEPFYVTANVSDSAIGMPELQLEIPSLYDYNETGNLSADNDTGFFVDSAIDTGGLTDTTPHTIYTPNITEVVTQSSADWGEDEKSVTSVLIRFSEPINLTNPADVLELTNDNFDISTADVEREFRKNFTLTLDPEVDDGDALTGIEYTGDGDIVAANSSGSYELTKANSTIEKVDGVNNAPTADAGDDTFTVTSGEELVLDGGEDSTDPEGDDLDYTWKIISGPGEFGNGEDTAEGETVTFEAPDVSSDDTTALSLEVNDTELTDTFSFDIITSPATTDEQQGGTGAGSGEDQQDGEEDDQQEEDEPEAVTKTVVVPSGESDIIDVATETVGDLEVTAVSGRDIVGSIEYEETDSRPSSVTEPPGVAYKYVDIVKQNFNNRQVDQVRFEFKVSKGWIQTEDIAPGSIKLLRYSQGWLALDTSMRSEDSGNYYYEATSPGFSVFTVTGDTYASLIEVTSLEVDREEIDSGGNVTITATVTNNAGSSTDYTLEVDAGGETLTRGLELEANSNETVTFQKTFTEGGSQQIQAGGKTVSVQVNTEGLPWLMIGAGLLALLGLAATYLFWPEITSEIGAFEHELASDLSVLKPDAVAKKLGKLGAVPRVLGEIFGGSGTKKDYKFEGFGDESDFDYSFDEDRRS